MPHFLINLWALFPPMRLPKVFIAGWSHIYKHSFYLLIVLSFFCDPNGQLLAADSQHPNVVFILIDDSGMECYGCYGSQYYKTPNIDKLAAEGARFVEAYSQPKCTPSRVQLLTGKHNFRNYTEFGDLDLTQPTFAQSIKKAGYTTCVAGKWQLTTDNYQGPYTVGFDEYCLWDFGKDKEEGKFKGERYKSPTLYLNAQVMKNTEGKYGPDLTFDFITDFIQRNQKKPFFAYYTSLLAHRPFTATPTSKDWAEQDKSIPQIQHFKEMIEYADGQVGKLVKFLEENHLRENTVIIFTADNGTYSGLTSPYPPRGSIVGGKGKMIDDGNHVPFIINWPGQIKPGTVVKAQIDFTDVFPTLCAITHAPMPEKLDGQNLIPFTQGDESHARDHVFQSYSLSGVKWRYFVRQGPYKLYQSGELYNVPQDWLEQKPLTSPETAPIRKKLQAIMDDYLKDTKRQSQAAPHSKSSGIEETPNKESRKTQ